jgi:endoglucanase
MISKSSLGVLSLCVSLAACKTLSGPDESELRAESEPSSKAVWTSEDGNVLLNGKVFHLKGANWFGLETGGANLLGLSRRSMASILDWLKEEEFNSLRIPLSVEWALQFDHVPADQTFAAEDADLRGKPWVDILDKLITESGKRGIVIMLDMHTIGAGDNLTTKRWYSEKYSICDFRTAWQRVLDRFGDRWNIFALDLKNELHDVDWGNADLEGMPPTVCRGRNEASPPHNGKRPTDWKQEVESLIPELAIERVDPSGKRFVYNGLYLVQGMHHGKVGHQSFPYDIQKPFGFWFGGNLEGLRNYPLQLPTELANRIAYTIHVYGPSVYNQQYFEDLGAYRNPKVLDEVYESQNAFVERTTGRALIIGEWGGINEVLKDQPDPSKNGKDDGVILSAIAKWFPEHCVADAFWWAINPESTDTGGLFETDYQRAITHKLDRARTMMPQPTKVRLLEGGTIDFVSPGAFNPKCVAPKSCRSANRDGTTCADLRLSEGENSCKWGQKWRCEDSCAVWAGTCE